MASVARLTEVLRRPFTRRIDRHEIGRQVNRHWVAGAAHLVAADATGLVPAVLRRHMEYMDFVADPFGAVTKLYQQFGLSLAPDAARRIKSFIAAKPKGGYGGGASRLEDYGLSAPSLRADYRSYIEYFAIAPELNGRALDGARRSTPGSGRPRGHGD